MVVATALICGTGVSAEAAVQKPSTAQAGALDVTESADGDLTLSYDSGESLDQDVLGLLVAQIDARNARLSDTIREDFQNYDVKTPGDGFTTWVSFDATISATPTGIDFVIPESEVHTEASWWQNIIAATAGLAMHLFARTVCIGFFPEAAVVCGSVGAFLGTVAGRFTVQAFEGEVTNGEEWANTLLYAVAAAAGAAIWEAGLGAWAKTKLPDLIKRCGEWLKNDLPRHLKGWWSWGKDAAITAGSAMIRFAGWVYEKGKSFLPEWGSGNLPGRLRIMVVGDSMSQGDEGDWTWRYRLWEWFRNEGVSVDFVGPYRGTKPPADAVAPSPPPLQGEARDESSPPRTWGGYAELQTFDSDHFAVWGRQAAQDKKLIRQAVTEYQPDLLLVGLGFNDMGWFVSGPEGTLDSMKELVDQARAAKPDIKFALANVPQRTFIGGREDLPVKTNNYNRMLAAAVPRWSTAASRVALVDWRGHYSCDVDSCPAGYDGLHPNALGEYQIAQAFARTLHDTYGIGASLPAIPPAAPSRPTPVPSGVVARSVPSGIKVTWDRMYGAHGYTVRHRIKGSAEWSEFSVSANRFDTTWTTDGMEWEYQVRTDNGDQKSDWSPVVSATSHPQTTPPPTDIVTRATATGVDVSWKPPTGEFAGSVDRYEVITWDRDTPGTFIQSVGIRGTSAHIDGLEPGRRYLVAVATWNAAGGGLPDIARSVVVGAGTPSVPTGLKVTSTDPTTVQLTWNASSQAAGYRVWIRNASVDGGGTYEPDMFTADGTSHGVGFLFPGTWNYEFCVTAFNGSAESSRSECVVAPRPEDTAGDPGGNPGGTADTLDDLNELTQALRGSASMTG